MVRPPPHWGGGGTELLGTRVEVSSANRLTYALMGDGGEGGKLPQPSESRSGRRKARKNGQSRLDFGEGGLIESCVVWRASSLAQGRIPAQGTP